jgi:hypothetical protein
MLASRVVEIGGNALPHGFLNGYQRGAHACIIVGTRFEGLEFPSFHDPMAAYQGDNTAGQGIADRRNDRLDNSWGSSEGEPMPDPDLGASGSTSIKRLIDRPCILRPHAVADGRPPDVFRRDPNKRFEGWVYVRINKAPSA